MSKNTIVPFAFEGKTCRVVMENSDPWWVGVDVCECLGFINPRQTLRRLSADDVTKSDVMDSRGRKQKTILINEPALYELIIRSSKPAAKKFRSWITHEVLPSIFRTGTYSVPGTSQPQLTGSLESHLSSLHSMVLVLAEEVQRLAVEQSNRGTVLSRLSQLSAAGNTVFTEIYQKDLLRTHAVKDHLGCRVEDALGHALDALEAVESVRFNKSVPAVRHG